MQPDKIHLLSTRTLDDAVKERAADLHIEIDTATFIQTEPVDSDDLIGHLQKLSDESICVVFTSVNAVVAVAEQIQKPNNWKIFCTGGRTKEFAINAFGEESIIASAKNASSLAERIIASERIVKVTFFCGDQRLNDLSEKLHNNGITTDEVIVYTTVQTPVFIEKNYDGILFFSPSAVHSFFSMNTLPTDVALFSIGQTTTSAIQSYCTNHIITSEWPGTESLLELAADYYKTASNEAE